MKEFILKQKTPTCFELHRFIIREYIKQVSYNTNIICFYNVSIIIQQDATIYNLFISAKCSTCFGWYLHPPSRSHITVSTVSGITETVAATCREREWMGTAGPIQTDTSIAVAEDTLPVGKLYSLTV